MRALCGEAEAIGDGITRVAYLIDGVVYKVEHDNGANAKEYHNGIELRDITPDNVIVPEMTLYYVAGETVLAMPYIDGKAMGECMGQYGMDCDHKNCFSGSLETILDGFNNDATSYGNVIYREGHYYMIDLSADNNVRTLA